METTKFRRSVASVFLCSLAIATAMDARGQNSGIGGKDNASFAMNLPQVSLEGAAWTGFGIPGAGEIAVQGNYAYVVPGEGDFQIVDILDKNNPKIVGHLPVAFVVRLVVDGQYAYLQHPEAIMPVDIVNPLNPRFLNVDINQTIWDVQGGCAAQARVRNGYLFLAMHAEVGGIPLPCESTVSLVDDFVVLNVNDPLNFTQVAHLNLGSGAISLFLNGNYAYVGLVSGGVAIVDITIPAQPILKGVYQGEPGEPHAPYLVGHSDSMLVLATWNPVVLDFHAHAGALFASSDPVQVILVDASDPMNPVRRGHYQFADTPVFPSAVTGSGNYLYIVDTRIPMDMAGTGPFPGTPATRLLTLDIQDPTAPQLVSQYQTEFARMTYVTLKDGHLYVTEGFHGLQIFSLANPASPQVLGKTPTASEGRYAWVNDEETLAYSMDSGGGTRIHVIDVTDKANPVRRGFYWDGSHQSWTQFEGRGTFLYVPGSRDSGSSVDIVDVSNPDLPVKVGAFPASSSGPEDSRISLAGSYAYVVALTMNPATGLYDKILRVYDIANPGTPALQSSLALSTAQAGAVVSTPQLVAKGAFVYLTLDDEHALIIVDVQNPAQPQIVSRLVEPAKFSFNSSGGEWGGRLAIAKGYAYILTGEDYTVISGTNTLEHFHIVDVRDPANPVYKKAFADSIGVEYLYGPNDAFLTDIATYDNENLLLISAYDALPIFDISDPLNPRFLLDVPGDAGVAIPFGWPQAAGWSLGRVVGQRLYSPTIQGLNIIRIATATDVDGGHTEIPKRSVLRQDYPNPFNPGTTIEYFLRESGNTKLAIYSLLGRKVRTLVSADQRDGNYSVVWGGRDDLGKAVASGIYFYRLKSKIAGEQIVQTRKLLLVR